MVISEYPFEQPSLWDKIANMLSEGNASSATMSGRCCKDRTIRLLKQFKADDAQSLKTSGTEEDYKQKDYLLTQIAELETAAASKVSSVKNSVNQKSAEEKKLALEICAAAMDGRRKVIPGGSKRTEEDLETTEEDTRVTPGDRPCPEKKKKTVAEMAMTFLQEKSEREAALKREELELKRQQLELDKEKLRLEKEEHQRMWEMLVNKNK